jgi:hypothetical protein
MMAAMDNKYRTLPAYPIVYSELITAARYRGTVTYQEVAQLMGLPLTGAYMGSEVGNVLGAISEYEVKCGRPMLSAVVTNKAGKVSDGFFSLATSLGKLKDNSDEARASFLENERQQVYDTWQRKLK